MCDAAEYVYIPIRLLADGWVNNPQQLNATLSLLLWGTAMPQLLLPYLASLRLPLRAQILRDPQGRATK